MRRYLCAILLAATAFPTGIRADVLFARPGAEALAVANLMTQAWSQTDTWTNVDVVLQFYAGTSDTRTGEAYLTTAIGPGATVADEVASATLTSSATGLHTITAFTGLTLGPGTYYLSYLANVVGDDLYWRATQNAASVGPGVSDQGGFIALIGTPVAPYPPATSSTVWAAVAPSPWTVLPVLEISGTREASAVPEPGGLVLLATAVGMMVTIRRAVRR